MLVLVLGLAVVLEVALAHLLCQSGVPGASQVPLVALAPQGRALIALALESPPILLAWEPQGSADKGPMGPLETSLAPGGATSIPVILLPSVATHSAAVMGP